MKKIFEVYSEKIDRETFITIRILNESKTIKSIFIKVSPSALFYASSLSEVSSSKLIQNLSDEKLWKDVNNVQKLEFFLPQLI